jgi:hypothetical protein
MRKDVVLYACCPRYYLRKANVIGDTATQTCSVGSRPSSYRRRCCWSAALEVSCIATLVIQISPVDHRAHAPREALETVLLERGYSDSLDYKHRYRESAGHISKFRGYGRLFFLRQTV